MELDEVPHASIGRAWPTLQGHFSIGYEVMTDEERIGDLYQRLSTWK